MPRRLRVLKLGPKKLKMEVFSGQPEMIVLTISESKYMPMLASNISLVAGVKGALPEEVGEFMKSLTGRC